ncbi:aminotransferase class I/II-fold pyridoxal phosphate-dependent enzyme [bacterium]|nr:aminotransferase class I/II-fold pyridoxal phosphate-dependent enzyme [bacterium]
MIDLRSDTVTIPTPEMKTAMIAAPLGDDVYGEDPTVNRLQKSMAALFGMEAGLFVPTGVMSNQIGIKAWTQSGDEVIVERESHIFNYETAAPSMMSAVQLHTVGSDLGVFALEDVEAAIRPGEYYYPRTSLVCIENTHNRYGGTLYPIEDMRALSQFCADRDLRLHLDGARIWNAHAATGTPLSAYGEVVDSVSICFSKGLGAPVGSMLLGPADFIARAHKYRKIFGGGMRQSGMLAAAAQYAIEHHLPLLARDHARARTLAEGLADIDAFTVDIERVQSNMVLLDFTGAAMRAGEAQAKLAEEGIRIGMGMGDMLRAVVHIDLNDDDITRALEIFHRVF